MKVNKRGEKVKVKTAKVKVTRKLLVSNLDLGISFVILLFFLPSISMGTWYIGAELRSFAAKCRCLITNVLLSKLVIVSCINHFESADNLLR